jgi:NADPH:quinone reductase-like Zn-dependent oxidoreductase
MRAAVCTRYGPPEVVELQERPVPSPGPGELLVRVRASTVSSADRRIRALDLPRGFGPLARPALGFARPRRPVLGTELAGDVVALGAGVTGFAPGDAVFAFPGAGLGAHAEYACVRAERAAPKPSGLDWSQAAALCFGGTTMLDFYRRGGLAEGERVLVNGASGTVGTAAVRLACDAGARVTGVCSADAADLVRALGAERVIDRGAEDFARSGELWDVIVDVAGTAPWRRSAPLLAPRGRLLLVLADLPAMLSAPWHTWVDGRRVVAGPVAERGEDVRRLGELAAAGRFVPVIDRVYPFEAIRDAHARVDSGRKRGSVVVRMGDPQH